MAGELAERVEQDLNGGTGNTSPPVRCPGCGVLDRYSRFDVMDEVPPDG